MNHREYLFVKISEESHEVGKEACKCSLRATGLMPVSTELKPDSRQNKLMTEFYQLQALVEYAIGLGYLPYYSDDKISEIQDETLRKVKERFTQ